MSEDLTDKQKKFLELVFLPEYQDNFTKAAIAAGYSEGTHASDVLRSVSKQYIERLDYYLASKAAKAISKIDSVLDTPDAKGAKALLEASAMILDRIGVSKKERIEIEHKSVSGIFILPKKTE